jgi:hypothetical protein
MVPTGADRLIWSGPLWPSSRSSVAVLALATACAGAAPTDQFASAATREELFSAPSYKHVTLSPDGKSIAMLRPTGPVLNIWVAPLSDPTKAVPLTHFDDRGVDTYRWTPDSRYILVEKDIAGEEHTQIYAVDVTARTVTPLTGNPAVQSKIVRTSGKVPGKALISYNDRDPHYADVYLVDLATGKRELVLKNDDHYTSFLADKQLTVPDRNPRQSRGRVVDLFRPFRGNAARFLHGPPDRVAQLPRHRTHRSRHAQDAQQRRKRLRQRGRTRRCDRRVDAARIGTRGGYCQRSV